MKKTAIDKGTGTWVTIPYVSTGHRDRILSWIEEADVDVTQAGVIIHPETFEPMQKWFIKYKEDKTIFFY